MCPWMGYSICLSLSFLIFKVGVIVVASVLAVELSEARDMKWLAYDTIELN